MKRFKKEDLKTQVVSDFGMTAELYIDTGEVSVDDSVEYPLFKVYESEESEEKFVEFSSNGRLIQIPIAVLKEFLLWSENEVHSEAWYEKNVFNKGSNT